MDGITLLTEIIGIIVGGFTEMGSGLGAGISSFVTAIMFSGEVMSAFAILLFIFVAINLSMSLFRWVLNFVTSLGQRNR